ncbi:histidine phosphatase family protein [Butyrivibrio sp. VCB2006]|uniref:histidine phosphatase family protein n=1 Tax=Butyrivibrio sp. VCB2006 TaxID=1280679 RepID=UPI000427594A|nr:histidine phosphatase family protein [Butyrivibrio sp. VCB2006]
MRLIFVRHGEPNYADDCLTDNGIVQAKATAKRLEKENIKEIYSSPMGRAMKTASFTAENHGLKIKTRDFMHEIDWGNQKEVSEGDPDKLPFDGHPWTLGYKLLTENQEFIGGNNWEQHPYFKNNRCMNSFDKISEGIDEILSSYGLKRHNGYYLCEEENHDTIALFAHGGSGAVMFSHVLNIPFPVTLTMLPYGVCSVSVLAFDGCLGDMVIPRFEIFNDMRHMENIALEKINFDK